MVILSFHAMSKYIFQADSEKKPLFAWLPFRISTYWNEQDSDEAHDHVQQVEQFVYEEGK